MTTNGCPRCAVLEAKIAKLEEIIQRQQAHIERLESLVEKLQKMAFGAKTERKPKNRVRRSGNAAEKPANGHGRQKLPRDLPRQRVEHELTGKDLLCPECGRDRQRIGEEVSEQLEFVPSSLFVLEHVVGKYACPCGCGVATASKPMQPIEKGLAGPGLLAHIVTSKYADHLPLNRQEDILARHGVDLSRSTMCDWMASVAELTRPLYELMAAEIRRSKVIHTDDTPVPVQDRALQKTRTGRFWVYVGDRDHPYDVFDYTPNRKLDGPVAFLGVGKEGEYEGYLHADAYGGYDGLYAGRKIRELACWAHARRKFVDAESTEPIACGEALAMIGELYAAEDAAKALSPPERGQMRLERSGPVLARFHGWLESRHTAVLPRGPIGMAIAYTLSNWEALTRYVDDGDLAIDNNRAERALRTIAIGRKNWEFCGSDRGGRTAAVHFTLIASAKRQGHDPFAYLRDVFARIASHPASRLGEFLPDRWKPQAGK